MRNIFSTGLSKLLAIVVCIPKFFLFKNYLVFRSKLKFEVVTAKVMEEGGKKFVVRLHLLFRFKLSGFFFI